MDSFGRLHKRVTKFLHHLIVPHEGNNHRSKLLHHDSLLLVIAFLFFCSSLMTFGQRNFPSVLGISNNVSINDLLTLTNEQRRAHGLAPLSLNGQLSQAAAAKAQDMLAKNYWAHMAPDGGTPWGFIKGAGYSYLYAGENLARGFNSAPEIVNAWMASPSHRDNMLSANYTEVGFAAVPGTLTGAETILVVEMFGSKYAAKEESAETATQASAPTAVPVPTKVIAKVIVPSSTPIPPTLTIVPSQTQEPAPPVAVAAIQSNPLIDSKSFQKNLSYFLLFLFIAVLIIDAIIIERKQIARLVSHNLDHIIFLGMILIAAIIIGKGLVL